MSEAEKLQASGDKIRKAVTWISESVQAHPQKNRMTILQEAQIQFDLSPRECEFVESKLCGESNDTGQG